MSTFLLTHKIVIPVDSDVNIHDFENLNADF